MISTRIVPALLVASCAHSTPIPPKSAVENDAPIGWPLRPLEPLPERAEIGPLALDLGSDFVAVRSEGPEVRISSEAAQGGTSLDRGYARRFGWISDRLERYVEVFRGSPIVSLFQRIHRGPIAEHSFEIPPELDEMIADGEVGPRRTAILDPTRVKRPIVIFRNRADSEGAVLFFPHRPELRRWFVEDYTVTATVSAYVEAKDTIAVRFPAIVVPDSPRMSFDFPIYVMPYRGTSKNALEQLDVDDTWNPRPSSDAGRMLRYFPTEFASWIDATPYPYGHPGGYAWGDTTAMMKGISTDPLDPRALLRDQAFRMLTFFVEAGRAKGAPPNRMMAPQWTKEMEDPHEIRTIVFCQYWEFRLQEFERLFDSPHVTAEEKSAVYDDLQTARRVFDPIAGAFAKPTPNGGVWFDYLDLPIADPMPWIINTHSTNVANAGAFARLAKKMGRDDDYDYWRRLFVAGLDGQEYAVSQDWMWKETDPNELRYARAFEGPQSYHYYMLLAWVPYVGKLAGELAPDRIPALLDLMRRLMKAQFIQKDAKATEEGRSRIAEMEALSPSTSPVPAN
jgi:hypothetical protein